MLQAVLFSGQLVGDDLCLFQHGFCGQQLHVWRITPSVVKHHLFTLPPEAILSGCSDIGTSERGLRQNRTGTAALTPAAHGQANGLYQFFGEKHFMVPVCRIRAARVQIRGACAQIRGARIQIQGAPVQIRGAEHNAPRALFYSCLYQVHVPNGPFCPFGCESFES
jgi:hypothetical protein